MHWHIVGLVTGVYNGVRTKASAAGLSAGATKSLLKQDGLSWVEWRRQRFEGGREDRAPVRPMYAQILKAHMVCLRRAWEGIRSWVIEGLTEEGRV